jgi:uroporphyrinogen III methyltransferase/synthase
MALGTVYLVGAGPGDPGLLTLRAVECLRLADVVIYDKLTNPRLLDFARPTAERIAVSDLPPDQSDRWPGIRARVLAAVHMGQHVVRLKGGDPIIYGRGGEEAEILRADGIPFEIVPGVTAALGAAAYAEIALTHRDTPSAVLLVTGHENPARASNGLDWALVAQFPGTLAVYMGFNKLIPIVGTLLQHGMDPTMPAALVQLATSGDQKTLRAPLGELPQRATAAGLIAPAMIFIGPVLARCPPVSWFEAKPLAGRRVLVTRPRGQAEGMIRQLELLGAVPYALPTVDIGPPSDWGPVDAVLARLREFDWLVFTSSNGVSAFFDRLLAVGLDVRAVGHLRLACIGPATAQALARYHLRADVVPARFDSETLAAVLGAQVRGQRVLLARADRGRDVLRAELQALATVEQVAVYRQTDVIHGDAEVLDRLRRGEIGFITLTSSNIARSLSRLCDDTIRERMRTGSIRLVTISAVTSADVRALGYPVAAEATTATEAGVLAALVQLAQTPGAELGG